MTDNGWITSVLEDLEHYAEEHDLPKLQAKIMLARILADREFGHTKQETVEHSNS